MRLPASIVSLLLAAGCAHAAPARETTTNTDPRPARASHRNLDAEDEQPRREPESPPEQTDEFEDGRDFWLTNCPLCGMG